MTVMTRINRRFENVWASCHIRNSSLNHRDDWTGCVAPPPLSEVNQFEESIYVSVWYDLGRWWGDGWRRRYWRAVRGRTIRWFSIFILFWRALVVCCFVRICSNEMKLNWRFQIKSKKIDLLNKSWPGQIWVTKYLSIYGTEMQASATMTRIISQEHSRYLDMTLLTQRAEPSKAASILYIPCSSIRLVQSVRSKLGSTAT